VERQSGPEPTGAPLGALRRPRGRPTDNDRRMGVVIYVLDGTLNNKGTYGPGNFV
jgi:hypothetical protein